MFDSWVQKIKLISHMKLSKQITISQAENKQQKKYKKYTTDYFLFVFTKLMVFDVKMYEVNDSAIGPTSPRSYVPSSCVLICLSPYSIFHVQKSSSKFKLTLKYFFNVPSLMHWRECTFIQNQKVKGILENSFSKVLLIILSPT